MTEENAGNSWLIVQSKFIHWSGRVGTAFASDVFPKELHVLPARLKIRSHRTLQTLVFAYQSTARDADGDTQHFIYSALDHRSQQHIVINIFND